MPSRPRHLEVGDQRSKRLARELGGRGAVLGARRVPLALERLRHEVADPLLVVGDQDARHHHPSCRGMLTRKTAPPPGRFLASIRPPCPSTI